jgi:tetratricopeptide (TPR) repeat protein
MQNACVRCVLLVAFLAASSLHLGAQFLDPISELQLSQLKKGRWIITGQVKDLKGTPVSNARVKVQCVSTGAVPNNTLVADVQGKYSYTVELESQTNTSLSVIVSAEKEGFLPAHETANFTKIGETWPIDLVMRADQEDASSLSQEQLLAALVSRYKAANPPGLAAGSARQNFVRAAEMVIDPQNSAKAVPLLSALVNKSPQCVECQTLLGLAELQTGSLAAAQRDFSEAALVKLRPSEEPRIVNSLIALGVLAEWSGESPKALDLLMRAAKLALGDPLALQEVGRALLIQKNWEAADEYLLKAEKAGAPPEARLLRCRAALEEGDAQEADQEIRAYMADREIKSFPLFVHALYAEVQAQASMLSFSQKPLVDEPLSELLKAYPDLEGLQPAADQSRLPAIMEKIGAMVETFFKDFQNATSRERVAEEKLDKHGKMKQILEQHFQYLLVTTALQNGLSLEEYRTDQAGRRIYPSGSQDGFMLSTGFASASLLFHPAYQGGSKFRHLGRAKVKGTDCDVVAFAQVPAKAKMNEIFNAPGTSVVVLHQGVAWIDPNSSRIVRLRTDLLQAVPKVRLQRETTEINYAMVQFKEVPEPVSLPAQVTVTVDWKGHTFQNQHQYSDFRLFNTAVHEKHPTPQAAPPPDPTPN